MMTYIKSVYFYLLFVFAINIALGQSNYWQQKVSYKMEIDMDITSNIYSGIQELTYYNNSPDTLTRLFYHLYLNAFQPGSMMDVRSITIADPDFRVKDRISKLKPDETGYLKVKSLDQDGSPLQYTEVGTILEVKTINPILPGTQVLLTMEFEGKVPIQIRRTGRNNIEGIDYSMSQWYPKLAEYDDYGWHANPYIGREFFGVWGDFDVKIAIDKSYVLGATGYLQNADEIGHGYSKSANQKVENGKLTWHFFAPDVHDFVWAADPDYTHDSYKTENGTELHFFYVKDSVTENTWASLPFIISKTLNFLNSNYGVYPYQQFSFIQGGDGGMEYPMSTLILGRGTLNGLILVSVHELIHSWYYGVLGNNENLHSWMDEGFETYVEGQALKMIFDPESNRNPHTGSYNAYFTLINSGKQEPLTTHADHYIENNTYAASSYAKGAVLLNQLSYIIGQETFDRGMKRYYNNWKFKHPSPNDFKRVMEKESGIILSWYFEYFLSTTKTIDYGIKDIDNGKNGAIITLERINEMPMPIDLSVEYTDGTIENYNIPLRMMRGIKTEPGVDLIYSEAWPWTNKVYKLQLNRKKAEIAKVEIDKSQKLADLNRDNNILILSKTKNKTN